MRPWKGFRDNRYFLKTLKGDLINSAVQGYFYYFRDTGMLILVIFVNMGYFLNTVKGILDTFRVPHSWLLLQCRKTLNCKRKKTKPKTFCSVKQRKIPGI